MINGWVRTLRTDALGGSGDAGSCLALIRSESLGAASVLDGALDHRQVFSMAGRHLRWTGVAAILVLLAGFGLSLILGMHGVAQLGMLHLPAAWLSLLLMLVVAFWSVVGIISGSRLPCLIAQSVAPTGGMFTFLALWSGSLWMRAVEGVWWLGDARQIAELALLVVYLTMLALPSILRDAESADRAIGVTALVGGSLAITLFFVVDGWLRLRGAEPPALLADTRLLWPMVLVGCGLWLYSTFVGLVRLRCLIKEREFGLSEYFAAR